MAWEKLLDSNLVTTPSVVDCTSGMVPAHIVNGEAQTLFKNVTLGALETVPLASTEESLDGPTMPSINSSNFLPEALTTDQQDFPALFK